MCARHDGIVNSRHTKLLCRNVSWWLRTVVVRENCSSSSSRRENDAKEISQGKNLAFSTPSCVTEMRLLSPSAWEVHTVNMKQPGDGGKKRKKHIKYSVRSLQLCQYRGKWILNILHRPPKWREGEGGGCKTYNCCSVLERLGIGKGQGRSKIVKWGKDKLKIQRQRERQNVQLALEANVYMTFVL